jgi:hypothetical protein
MLLLDTHLLPHLIGLMFLYLVLQEVDIEHELGIEIAHDDDDDEDDEVEEKHEGATGCCEQRMRCWVCPNSIFPEAW